MKKIICTLYLVLVCFIGFSQQAGSTITNSIRIYDNPHEFSTLWFNNAPTGPNYGCLSSQPDPIWFHFVFSSGNSVAITVNGQGNDVDAAVWGPFDSLEEAETSVANGSSAPIDCSESGDITELLGFSTVPGKYYMLVVVNPSNHVYYTTITNRGSAVYKAPPPSVTTVGSSNIGNSTARCSGDVTNDNSSTVTERGIAYGNSLNPSITGTHTSHSSGGTGSYYVDLSGLSMGTTYHYRAYATSAEGTGYGDDLTFTTLTNQPPTADNDSWIVYVNDSRVFTAPGVLDNDSDPDSDPIAVGNPGNRTTTLGVTVNLASDGSFTYSAPTDQVDVSDSFTYYATDTQANSSPATVLINLRNAIYDGTASNETVTNWNGGYIPNSITDVIFQSGNVEVSSSMVVRNLIVYEAASFFCTGSATITVNNSIGNEHRTGLELSSPVILRSGIEINGDSSSE